VDAGVREALSKRKSLGIPIDVKTIIQLEMRDVSIFRKWTKGEKIYMDGRIQNVDKVIGLVGERGSGKSLSAATIAFKDYMLLGQPCFSNLGIARDLEIPEELYRQYEAVIGMPIKREVAHYESIDIDFKELLSFNPQYRDGVILVDEENIALSDARRSMSNQSLAASDFIQQLRKMRCAFIHTCIDEMFVENRIRDATDLFISCRDIAYYSEYQHQNPGVTFEWKLYPMSGRIYGYESTLKALGTHYEMWRFHGRKSWGLMDTWERQQRRKYGVSLYGETTTPDKERYDLMPDVKQSEEQEEQIKQWSWLYKTQIYQRLATGSMGEIERWQLVNEFKKEMPRDIEPLDSQDLAKWIEHEFKPLYRMSNAKKFYYEFQRKKIMSMPYSII